MKLLKNQSSVSSDGYVTIPLSELKRLIFLENGVVNYSGGVFNIMNRINNVDTQDMSSEIIMLLGDLKCYFRDIIICGRLID